MSKLDPGPTCRRWWSHDSNSGLSGSKSVLFMLLETLQEVEVLVKKSIDFIVHLISIERCFHGFLFLLLLPILDYIINVIYVQLLCQRENAVGTTRVLSEHLPQPWSSELLCFGMQRLEQTLAYRTRVPFPFHRPAGIVSHAATRLPSSAVLSSSQIESQE